MASGISESALLVHEFEECMQWSFSASDYVRKYDEVIPLTDQEVYVYSVVSEICFYASDDEDEGELDRLLDRCSYTKNISYKENVYLCTECNQQKPT